jgi:glyoxylase-like metal-dependent hydrolase (beta-lactamase superfamily II)
VFSGDLMHSPVQCRHPEWRARPDYDAQQARDTRRAFMERYVETDVLVCTAHFPLPSAGHFVRRGDVFDFEYDQADW